LSSVIGSLIVIVYAARRFRPAAEPLDHAARRRLLLLVGFIVGAMALGASFPLLRPGRPTTFRFWYAYVFAARYGALAITAGCALALRFPLQSASSNQSVRGSGSEL
jgi:hypothetical protein